MEIFPASDTEQFEYIKKAIDECDYYVLIIGARYGSVDSAGMSFTEKEYDYAIEKNIPVLAFPHGDIGSIPNAKSETDPKTVERLRAFRSRATTGRLVQFWKTRPELKTKVLISLSKAFLELPGNGWVRAARASNENISLGTISATQTSSSDTGETPGLGSATEKESPDATWGLRQYQRAMLTAMMDNDSARLKLINEAFLNSPHGATDSQRLTWEANTEYFWMIAGKSGHLQLLVALAEANPTISGVVEFLARAYSQLGEHGRAARAYASAHEAVSEPQKAAKLLRAAAKHFALDGDFKQAFALADKIRLTIVAKASNESILLEALLELANLQKDDDASIATMERLLELKPDDTDVRFKLAFKQSENSNHDLALHHYLKIRSPERRSGTWNNLGVCLEHFSLSTKAVAAYREAAKQDETIAMANVGSKLLSAGFIDEAQAECDKALKVGTVSKNVGDLIAKIAETAELEEKHQESILSDAKPKLDFYRSIGRAMALGRTTGLGGHWQGPDCILQITEAAAKVELVGTFERDRNALSLALIGGPNIGLIPKIKHSVRYSGEMKGNAFFGSVKRAQDNESLLSAAGGQKKVFMVLNEVGSEFAVMENSDAAVPTFYSITRLNP
jgi:tetratricopeptide (TPR) repeat protein